MRWPNRTLIVLALGILCAFSPSQAAAKEGWVSHPSPTKEDLHLLFVLEDEAWIVAHKAGLILYSADAGESWDQRSRVEAGYLEAIVFTDSKHGLLAGEKGRLLRTSDGGRSWTSIPLEPGGANLGALHVFDGKRGLLFGNEGGVEGNPGFALRTTNGGRSWRTLEPPLSAPFLSDASYFQSDGLGVVAYLGGILVTRDHGVTWSQRELKARDIVRGFTAMGEALWAVGHRGLLLRSTDQGKTWNSRPLPGGNLLRSVVFLDEERGFIVGNRDEAGGPLWKTLDGGGTWTSVPLDAPDLHRLVVGKDRVWAIGKEGTILSLRSDPPPVQTKSAKGAGRP